LKVLVTRPEPGARATAARLIALGHEPILAPCLSIVPRPAALPENPGAIIVTSGQAVPALPASYHQVTVFCVGDATAGRLRQAGFCSVESAGGDARDLFRLVTARRVAGAHLLACGARQGVALARQFREAGIVVERRVVYAARPVARLPEAALQALNGTKIEAALFYSAETARAFGRLAPPNLETIAAYALSPAIADGLRGMPWRAIHVAAAPTEADLLALLT
jgi:uroporphyrinogen-III synthase